MKYKCQVASVKVGELEIKDLLIEAEYEAADVKELVAAFMALAPALVQLKKEIEGG